MSVVWMVMREALRMLAIGTALGLFAALWLGRLVQSLLFGVDAKGPVAASIAVGVLALAGLIPAFRAGRVDRSLRCDVNRGKLAGVRPFVRAIGGTSGARFNSAGVAYVEDRHNNMLNRSQKLRNCKLRPIRDREARADAAKEGCSWR